MQIRVCVFAGAHAGVRCAYRDAAQMLGQELARRGIGLVYGGGRYGLMGALAAGALSSGGEVIGVIPSGLWHEEENLDGLTTCYRVVSLGEQKQKMLDLSDAFVALPGGYGTMAALSEVLMLAHAGILSKPVGLLDIAGFFSLWLRLQRHLVVTGFVSKPVRLIMAANVSKLLDEVLADIHISSSGRTRQEDQAS